MPDVVFRTKQNVTQEPKKEDIAAEEVHTERVHEPVPYTEYRTENGRPYTASYFRLGDNWEIFNEEVGVIEDYLQRKIDTGEIANEINTVEKEIKKMEKLHGLKDEPRAVVKIGTIASYIKFLNDTEGYKYNLRKYGNT